MCFLCYTFVSEGYVFASLDFWRQSPLPSVLDRSALCCLLYIRLCQWKLLHRWQVKKTTVTTFMKHRSKMKTLFCLCESMWCAYLRRKAQVNRVQNVTILMCMWKQKLKKLQEEYTTEKQHISNSLFSQTGLCVW